MITPPEYKQLPRLILAKEMAAFSRRYWGMYWYQRKHGDLRWFSDGTPAHLPIGVLDYPEIKCTLMEFLNMA